MEALNLLGLPLHPVTVDDLHREIALAVGQGRKAVVLNLNIHAVNLAQTDGRFRSCLEKADLVFCDGDGVRWGLRLLGYRQPVVKITYDRWLWQLAGFSASMGYRLFLLGSDAGVASRAAERFRERYPKIRIVGTHHGFFAKQAPENEQVIEIINRAAPDILVVGFGMPLQEKWIFDHYQRIQACVFLAAGAGLECVSGKLAPPPDWMIRAHLEWLFRWIQQPGRRFERYALGIPLFFGRVLLEKLRGGARG